MMPSVRVLLVAGLMILVLPSLVRASDVYLATWQWSYDVGDTVRFTVRNDHDETIAMPSFPFWRIVEDSTGDLGAGCSGLPTIHFIDPGESEDHSWAQNMCETGVPAVAGLYWLEIDYWVESAPGTGLVVRTAFCVGDGCESPVGVGEGVESSSWGHLKAGYR